MSNLLEEILLRPPLTGLQQNKETSTPALTAQALPQKMAYSINEIRELCGISRSSIYLEISGGTLQTVKRGKRTLILAADLKEWMSKWPATRR